MAIASMVCGIIGLVFGIVIIPVRVDNPMEWSLLLGSVSFVLLLIALIFGIIERKKGKEYKHYNMATAGFVMGLIGMIPLVLVTLIITITTGSIIGGNILARGGQSQTVIASGSPFVGSRSQYQAFTIGSISTTTKDTIPYSVVVDMVIGYDLEDNATATELTARTYELRDFVRVFFKSKMAIELTPENEARLKQEILEQLNTKILISGTARIIMFNQLDVNEMN